MRWKGVGRRRQGTSGGQSPADAAAEGGDDANVTIVEAVEVIEEPQGVKVTAEDDGAKAPPPARTTGAPASRPGAAADSIQRRPTPRAPAIKGRARTEVPGAPGPTAVGKARPRKAAAARGAIEKPKREKPFMSISLIAAVSTNNVIGSRGALPWDIPADMAHFKRTTMGRPVIVGRKTWEAIGGRLEGRDVFVLSKKEGYSTEGATVVRDVVDALVMTGQIGGEVFVAGGGEVYGEFLPLAEKLYITAVVKDVEGDTHFPKVFWEDWREIAREKGTKDKANPYDYWFLVYER